MEPVDFIERPTQLRGAVVPGLPGLPPGIERHPVPGGGTRAIELQAGDRFRVLDREGMQPAEIVFFGADGTSCAGHIGATTSGAPVGLQEALAQGGREGRAVLKALAQIDAPHSAQKQLIVFDLGGPPDDRRIEGGW